MGLTGLFIPSTGELFPLPFLDYPALLLMVRLQWLWDGQKT
jgi:hypothetical protein